MADTSAELLREQVRRRYANAATTVMDTGGRVSCCADDACFDRTTLEVDESA